MRRLRRENGEIAELTDAEYAAWALMFDAIYNQPEPDYGLAERLSGQIDAVRAVFGKSPLSLAA